MGSGRRIDPAGVAQLALTAAVFAGIAVSVASLTPHVALPAIIAIGVSAGAAGVLVQYWDWERRGGRAGIVMTNSWIRAGAIPSNVPRDTWEPLLRARAARASQGRSIVVVAASQIGLSIIHLVDSGATGHHVLWICAIGFWVGIAAWTLYDNLRWRRVIRGLLQQPRPAAVAPVADEHVHTP